MKFPHTVRLDGPDGSLRITRRLSDLQYRNDVNGGYGSGSFTLRRPISAEQLAVFSEVAIFDGRTAKQVGGGRILTPGRTNDQSGQVAKVQFIGEGLASMQDVEAPYFLIDQSLDQWEMAERNTRRFSADVGTIPGSVVEDQMLIFQAVEDKAVTEGWQVAMVNRLPLRCQQLLGGLGFRHRSGATTSNWQIRGRAYSASLASFDTPIDDDWTSSTSARRIATVNGAFSGRPVAGIQWRVAATGTATDDAWSAARDVIIRAQIYDKTRTLRTTGYSNEFVRTSEAFTDWVARYCPRLDIESAQIADTSYQFDQLAWPDGIDGVGLMDELLAFDAGLMWGAFEKLPNGRNRVELKVMPTDVRYEITVNDGYEDSSPTEDLCNVVYVTWTSPAGRDQVTRVPSAGVASVPALDAAGIVRSRVLSKGSDVGSSLQATKAGQAFLAQNRIVPNGGRVTVGGARRILDRYTGRMVAPWEIEPGYLARIRGIRPRVDPLNPANGPDGSTISRIVSMSWQDQRGSAVLELDTYTLSVRQKIVDLINKTPRRAR